MTQVPEFLKAILASIYGRLNKKNITVKNYRNKKKFWNGCQWDTCSYNHFYNIRWPYVKSPSFSSKLFLLEYLIFSNTTIPFIGRKHTKLSLEYQILCKIEVAYTSAQDDFVHNFHHTLPLYTAKKIEMFLNITKVAFWKFFHLIKKKKKIIHWYEYLIRILIRISYG